MLKRLHESFEVEVGKLQNGSTAVVDSQGRKWNISWLPKNVEIAFHCWNP